MPSFHLWLLKYPNKDIKNAVLHTVIAAENEDAAIALVTERIEVERPNLDLDEDYFFIVAKVSEATPEG